MKELRTFAAQSGTLKRLTYAGSAFCLFAFTPAVFADDVVTPLEPVLSPVSSLDSLSVSGSLSSQDGQAIQQSTSTSQQSQSPQQSLDTSFQQVQQSIQQAQSTLDTATATSTTYQISLNTDAIAAAQSAIDTATVAVGIAQIAVTQMDSQTIVVSIALQDLTNAQDSLTATTNAVNAQQSIVDTATATVASAQAIVDSATVNGLQITVYSDPQYGARPPVGAGTVIATGTAAKVEYYWGGGSVMGGPADRVQVNFVGQITPNVTGTMWFTPQADDGTILNIGGNVLNDWVDKGGGGGTLAVSTVAGVPQSFNLWFYENRGGAFVALYWYTDSGWQIVPASAFSTTSASVEQINALNTAKTDLSTATDTLNALQATQADQVQVVSVKQATFDSETATLVTLTNNAQVLVMTAQSLTDTATAQVASAVAALANTPAAPAPQPSPQVRPRPAVIVPAAPTEPTPTQNTDSSGDPASTPNDSQNGATDGAQNAGATPTDSNSGNGSSTPSTDSGSQQTTPSPTDSTQSGQSSSSTDSTSQSQSTNTSQTPTSTDSKSSTSPDSLPDTVPLLPKEDLLVPHIQQDIAGAKNGGIQFFGTKTQPQVIGEDGKLTPPPPPPGSGLPIPPDAITIPATFIGQPGGMTFNSSDVAVPVDTITVSVPIPGAQALADAYVAMANIGNDMSPVTRKKAKKILVTTVVLGQIVSLRRRLF